MIMGMVGITKQLGNGAIQETKFSFNIFLKVGMIAGSIRFCWEKLGMAGSKIHWNVEEPGLFVCF